MCIRDRLGRACVEQLLLCGAGDNVQKQPLAGTQHQGLAWYGAFEQLHLGRCQVKGCRGYPHRAPVHGEQHVGRAVVDDGQAVWRIEAISRLLRCDGQAEPVLRPFARDGLEGEVIAEEDRDAVEVVVRQIEGVQSIDNSLYVQPPPLTGM